MEAGLVCGEPGAHVLHAAESAYGNPPVVFTAPRAAPVLKLEELARSLLHKRLDRVLVTEPVAARDGVVGVLVERVVCSDRAGCAALGRDCVAPHGVDLRNHRHAEMGIGLGNSDRRPQTGRTAADEQHVMRHSGAFTYHLNSSSL